WALRSMTSRMRMSDPMAHSSTARKGNVETASLCRRPLMQPFRVVSVDAAARRPAARHPLAQSADGWPPSDYAPPDRTYRPRPVPRDSAVSRPAIAANDARLAATRPAPPLVPPGFRRRAPAPPADRAHIDVPR